MGILDEAIREHLELKRQHGADDSELKQLEDQAFGPPERPGDAEAPTEFMTQPDLGDEAPAGEPADEALNQEPPPVRREPAAGVADIQEPPEKAEELEKAREAEEQAPAEEEQPAAEHEAITSPVEHSTEERHAIADQPTQMFDVEEEFAAAEAPAPPDEDLVAEEMTEARLGPAEPLPPPQPEDEDEEDDFFDEQRLSDELDQALEAPRDPEPALDEPEPPLDEPEPALEEPEAPLEDPEPAFEPKAVADEPEAAGPAADEDVLEETPEFLEETPEDDELWFEQKPPKDFDFDD
jgi:hypothetical protein